MKELYLSIFVLFFRLTDGVGWGADVNPTKGVLGVAAFELLLVMCLFEWMQIVTGYQVEFQPS